jgi:hypothetical protein
MAHKPHQVPKGGMTHETALVIVRVEVDRILSDDMVVVIKRDGVVLGSANYVGLRVYEFIDDTDKGSTAGTMQVVYTAFVTNGSYVSPESPVYPVILPAIPSPPVVSDHILMEDATDIWMETGDPDVILLEVIGSVPPQPGPGLMVLDEFDGASSVNIVGRVPNLSDNGEAWIAATSTATQQMLMTGTGEVRVNAVAHTDLSNMQLQLSDTTAVRVEILMRSEDGISKLADIPATSLILHLRLDLGANHIEFNIYQSTDISAEIIAPIETVIKGANVWGAGGDPVQFDFYWQQNWAGIYADGILIVETTVNALSPVGPGPLTLNVASGNLIEYIEVRKDNW